MSEKYGSPFALPFILTADPTKPHNGLEVKEPTKAQMADENITKYTASDALVVMVAAVKAAKKNKIALNKWSFYIPEVSANLPKLDRDDPQRNLIPLNKLDYISKLLDEEVTVTCTLARYGKPKINLNTGKTVVKSTKPDTRIYI